MGGGLRLAPVLVPSLPATLMRRGRGTGPTPPVKGCSHAYGMVFKPERCWCEHCGQTWKMLTDRDTGEPRKWFPLPLSEASHGERQGGYW